jgi:hypothetical protein
MNHLELHEYKTKLVLHIVMGGIKGSHVRGFQRVEVDCPKVGRSQGKGREVITAKRR